ncbi:MAG: hypothetical protein ABIJ20_03730 [Nanoarchaeota archaeon]|nr:hypothetical protein [Nanoarchaeota archaeon]MBU1445535.1 hypothetical protein [Nanoarchaeota archaeon]MBU2406446.1 hypothetical protein [Nanoarchaeota archaeon]MBU2420634.1 hypothetical protein [Nanoarchaeota archaeon]MBU2474918.1 hypothetical protein [Nanoarchaeota archaeon]
MNYVKAVKEAQKDLRAINPKHDLLRMVLVSEGPVRMVDGSVFTPEGGESLGFTSKLTERYSERLGGDIEADEALRLYIQEIDGIVAKRNALWMAL